MSAAVGDVSGAAHGRTSCQSLPAAFDVHDLPIWPLSTTQTAAAVYPVVAQGQLDDRLL